MTGLLWSALERHLRTHAFGGAGLALPRIGVELELLALDHSSRHVAWLERDDGRSVLDLVRLAAAPRGWRETPSVYGVPTFATLAGGRLTFEPGGQIEYSSSVCDTIPAVLAEVREVTAALREAGSAVGIELLSAGIDPVNRITDVPLQLSAERYRRMAAYFGGIGPDGARMMRQTASVQVCLGGIDPLQRWRVLHAVAPYVVAMFANSRVYAGVDTGHASHRAVTWRGVDPARTGVLAGDDPVGEYLDFALRAPAFLLGDRGDEARPFGEWLDRATLEDWTTHLTTLFPEVRPRGYLEVRSADAVPDAYYPALLVLLAGLTYDDVAAASALELVGPPDPDRLALAGTMGVRHPILAQLASELAALACEACERMPSFVGDSVLHDAHRFFDEWTRQGMAPSDHATTVACAIGAGVGDSDGGWPDSLA